jgi:hypothetical protein
MAEHLARRKKLWGMRRLSGQIDPKPTGGRPIGFAGDTAKATGVDKRVVNRAISRANGVTEEARNAIRGTKLDTGAYLGDLNRYGSMSSEADKVALAVELENRCVTISY